MKKARKPLIHFTTPGNFYGGLCGHQIHHRTDGQPQRTECQANVTCGRCRKLLLPCATDPTHGYHAGRCGIA